jgi:hypothetical protein
MRHRISKRLPAILAMAAILALVACGKPQTEAERCASIAAMPALQNLQPTIRGLLGGDADTVATVNAAAAALESPSFDAESGAAEKAAKAMRALAAAPQDARAMDNFVKAIDVLGEEVQARCDLPLS